jgi:hypothetical protein
MSLLHQPDGSYRQDAKDAKNAKDAEDARNARNVVGSYLF